MSTAGFLLFVFSAVLAIIGAVITVASARPLRAAMGLPAAHRPIRLATLTEPLNSPAGKRQFRRGVLAEDRVVSYGPPASHHLRWLASANCLLEIPEDVTQIEAGTAVGVNMGSPSTIDDINGKRFKSASGTATNWSPFTQDLIIKGHCVNA